MSIIEKALDKSDDKAEPRQNSSRPAKARREQPTSRAGTRTSPRRSTIPGEQPQLPEIADEYQATGVAGRQEPNKNRPDFPRQTVKKIAVDRARLESAGIITPETKRTALVEQFRTIKRPILMKASASSNNRVPNGNLVLVTSALPAEGKTFTTINLAMSIAMELDHTVLLVDADVAKFDVSRAFGLGEAEGLADFLAQPERALSEFLVSTDIEKLTILPAGRPRVNVTELFASTHMQDLVKQFGQRYTDRIVVIDSPPLLAASGAAVLAHLVGQIVFVVEAIRTPQSAVEEALAQLSSIRNVGLVLNKSRSNERFGYQYGSYHSQSSD